MDDTNKFDKLLVKLAEENKSYAQWQKERYPIHSEAWELSNNIISSKFKNDGIIRVSLFREKDYR